MDFFTSTDLQRLASQSGQPYDAGNPSHQNIRQNLLDGPVRKTTHWAGLVLAKLHGYGYELTPHNQAHDLNKVTKRPMFKEYTWASFAKPGLNAANLYFTVGINQRGNFLVKLDYQRFNQLGRESERNLSTEERDIIENFLREQGGDEVAGVEIKRSDVSRYDWPALTDWAAAFIRRYDGLYDETMRALGVGGVPPAWGSPPPSEEELAERRRSYLTEAREIDPADDHYKMSMALWRQLRQLCGEANVAVESPTGYRTRMDLEVRNPKNDERIIFELKSGSGPNALRPAIREALGQLLEYAYWPDKPVKVRALVIATPGEPSDASKQFLARITLPDGAKMAYLQVLPERGADTERLRNMLRRYDFID